MTSNAYLSQKVLLATGGWLEQNGYDIRVLNLVNLEESDRYNPFRYIRDEKDALQPVNNLIQATTPKEAVLSLPPDHRYRPRHHHRCDCNAGRHV